jgi:flagellar protein FlbD
MITLTRLDGVAFAINCDLIERIDCVPETLLTLVDGTSWLVLESLADVIHRVQRARAEIVALSHHLDRIEASTPDRVPALRIVAPHEEQ